VKGQFTNYLLLSLVISSVDNFKAFLTQYFNAELTPYIKSEAVPEENDGPVKVFESCHVRLRAVVCNGADLLVL